MEDFCAYCTNILTSTRQKLVKPWDQIIHETTSFVVTPTVGALIEGWVLIITKRHVTAMGALSQRELAELSELCKEIKNLMRSNYGSTVVFEHGPAWAGTTFGCGIDHAHFHVVPLNVALAPLVEKELKKSIKWESISNIADLSIIYERKKSYLYILESDGQGITSCLCDIPSQLIRRVIANHLGIPHLYDYKKHAFRENATITFNKLRSAFQKQKCLVEVE